MKRTTHQKDYWKCKHCEHWDDLTNVCHGPFKGLIRTDPDFACIRHTKLIDWRFGTFVVSREQIRIAKNNGLNKATVRDRVHRWKDVERAITAPLDNRRWKSEKED
jgi:hypothetical protein